jgi:hypothetical protein
MHLLFADSVADQTIAELESRGHRCSVEPALATGELPALCHSIVYDGR